MNFKNFTFAELQSYCRNISAYVSVMFTPYNEANEKIDLKTFKLFKKDNLTISDCGFFQASKGRENLYFDFHVYLKDHDYFEPAFIQIWTKDDHENLKKIICEIINQS